MAEDREQGAPSLEPPSLFGRRKKRARSAAASETTSAPAPAPAPAPTPAPAEPLTPPVELADAVGSAVADPVVETQPEPVVTTTLGPTPDETPTTILDDVEPQPLARTVRPPDVEAPVPSEPDPPREPAPPRAPWLRGRPAALLTGVLVGALIVAATAGSLRLCTGIKGTSSCGGPGLFLLIAILLVAGLAGAALLRAAAVPQPGSTSFLAVGLLSVVTLLFLVDSIFSWWMIIVIPLVSVVTFLLSHWVTTSYIEPENEASERQRRAELHDVR
jgi:hypothetical protein